MKKIIIKRSVRLKLNKYDISPKGINFIADYESFTNKLSIFFNFNIKSSDGKAINQEFQIYCSLIEGKQVGNQYLIDAVNNSFEIK